MALNSAVTVDGKEIGRAQAYQAQAAIVPAHSDMNPVLIKPCSDTGAQIIINGEPYASMDAQQYHQFKPQALTHVMRAYQRLSNQYSHIVIEGAGSPAEINLRDNDIANMGFAESADCPVVLVGDIDRGGVFAQFLGTLECLSHSERARITGFIINRFRGDPSLLTPGIEWLEKRTNKPVFGVIPYLPGIRVAAEDAIDTQQQQPQADDTKLNVAIPVLPHISNHTDFDALRLHPQVNLIFVGPGQRIAPADLVIIPGSKTVRQDLQFLREQQWDHDINRHLRYGGKLIGICGGFQMLGNSIDDPLGVEGEPGQSTGLGFLSMHTELQPNKILRQASGKLRLTSTPVSGYEIHMGITRYTGKEKSFIESDDNNAAVAGLLSIDNQVAGTYLHGLFDTPQACTALLEWAGLSSAIDINPQQHLEDTINDIADCMEQHLDIETLLAACQSYHLKQSALQLSL